MSNNSQELPGTHNTQKSFHNSQINRESCSKPKQGAGRASSHPVLFASCCVELQLPVFSKWGLRIIGVSWTLAGKARVGISPSHYPATLTFVRGVNEAGFQQETPFGLEILQENGMRIHAVPWMIDGLVLCSGLGSELSSPSLGHPIHIRWSKSFVLCLDECSSTFLNINLGPVACNKIICIFPNLPKKKKKVIRDSWGQ